MEVERYVRRGGLLSLLFSVGLGAMELSEMPSYLTQKELLFIDGAQVKIRSILKNEIREAFDYKKFANSFMQKAFAQFDDKKIDMVQIKRRYEELCVQFLKAFSGLALTVKECKKAVCPLARSSTNTMRANLERALLFVLDAVIKNKKSAKIIDFASGSLLQDYAIAYNFLRKNKKGTLSLLCIDPRPFASQPFNSWVDSLNQDIGILTKGKYAASLALKKLRCPSPRLWVAPYIERLLADQFGAGRIMVRQSLSVAYWKPEQIDLLYACDLGNSSAYEDFLKLADEVLALKGKTPILLVSGAPLSSGFIFWTVMSAQQPLIEEEMLTKAGFILKNPEGVFNFANKLFVSNNKVYETVVMTGEELTMFLQKVGLSQQN